jgi:sec-independent protein translocase protein TatA
MLKKCYDYIHEIYLEVFDLGAFSPWHIILIAIVALLLFGPSKLPELGKGVGKMFKEFKDAANGKSSDESTTTQEVIDEKSTKNTK